MEAQAGQRRSAHDASTSRDRGAWVLVIVKTVLVIVKAVLVMVKAAVVLVKTVLVIVKAILVFVVKAELVKNLWRSKRRWGKGGAPMTRPRRATAGPGY